MYTIISRLIGGLGNQMFQYAIAKNICFHNQQKLKLDINAFDRFPDRKYQLNKLNVKAPFASNDEILQIKNYNYIKEKNSFSYDKSLINIKQNAYLEGYWQTPKYFSNIKNIISKDFLVTTKISKNNKELIKKIKDSNSICMHFRRGDYITNPKSNKQHGTCSINYYEKSLQYITKYIKNPTIFIFSDEPMWVKNNITFDYPIIYVDNNPPSQPFEDLRLMKHCKHFIIANSTFSWWGAWLAKYNQKIIIAPKKWFRKQTFSNNDLIPNSWIQI